MPIYHVHMYIIGHLDADCFYVSAERVRHPYLRGLPVGVLGNQGACVIAKSYEMKAAGVKTGTPIWDAVKLCPEGIFIKRDFRWYEVLSKRMLELLKTESPRVEYYSIDEMFFDASDVDPHEIQDRILREVGVPVSVGISKTKSLAKLISDTAKPFGCRTMLGVEIEPFLKSRPVEDITGIGERSRRKLASYNIRTCWDYATADRRLIRRLLTKKGEDYWWELNGTQTQPLLTARPPHKNISRGGSMGGTITDREKLNAWLVRNVERLIEELDYYGVFTGKLALWLVDKSGGGAARSINLCEDTAEFGPLLEAARSMLDSIDLAAASHMHLQAERLTYKRCAQKSLFAECDPRVDRVATVKQEINKQVGRFALRSGETLYINDLYDDEAAGYDVCDIHGKMCF